MQFSGLTSLFNQAFNGTGRPQLPRLLLEFQPSIQPISWVAVVAMGIFSFQMLLSQWLSLKPTLIAPMVYAESTDSLSCEDQDQLASDPAKLHTLSLPAQNTDADEASSVTSADTLHELEHINRGNVLEFLPPSLAKSFQMVDYVFEKSTDATAHTIEFVLSPFPSMAASASRSIVRVSKSANDLTMHFIGMQKAQLLKNWSRQA
ncbi:hypothetical protein HDV03_001360 [Kappamyces sp. JEL0829]|nr:hypothetical protein HDV03_001360 [Kappamyces sp. JEL0829]